MIRLPVIAVLAVLTISLFPGSLRAEGMSQQAYTAALLELNRTKASQNPAFTLGKDVMDRRILDKNQRTMGRVEDIILAPNGEFQTIVAKIDTSGFRETVSFDVASYIVNPMPGSFTVAMDKNQIKQNMPALMAQIETAAGEDAPLTVNTLRNGSVSKEDGTPVAKVQDVMVDNKSNQILALLVTILAGSNRGASIAIPYEASSASVEQGRANLTVTDEQAKIITSMATRR